VQVNQDDLKLNGTYQLLVYADDFNILGRSVHTINKNREFLVVVSKMIGLEENADDSKYTIMSQDQNAVQGHNIKIDSSSFERVELTRYLGTQMNQNSIQEEIKNRLNSGTGCCHMTQNPLTCRLLPKNIKIKVYRTIVLPVVL
jgi:hypothetical protein